MNPVAMVDVLAQEADCGLRHDQRVGGVDPALRERRGVRFTVDQNDKATHFVVYFRPGAPLPNLKDIGK
jgi:hypothetical protein